MTKFDKDFDNFKNNFKNNTGKYIQNVDEESIARVIKTYEDLYEKENFKNRSEIQNLAIHLATVIDLIYLNNTQKGGDNETECAICFGENKEYEPPIKIIECPRVAENKHGLCKLCWLKLWISKKFGINNGFECPICKKRLQLDDDEFNNIPENFKEFIRNRENLDMDNANIRDVIDAVELRGEGEDLRSHLTEELKGLISEPEYAIDIRRMAQEAERHEIRKFILILSITVAVQAYAYNNISSNQSVFLWNPNPSFMELLMNEYFRETPEPQQHPVVALFLILLVIGCFVFEIGISRNFIGMVRDDRNILRRHLEVIAREQLREEFGDPQEGGKRKRKTKKRKNKKRKNKKTKSKSRSKNKIIKL